MIYGYDLVQELADLLDREDEGLDGREEYALDELRELEDEVGGDLESIDVLIPVGDFEEYAREQASSMYGSTMEHWPMTSVDWEHAAEQLAYDYTEVDFRGERYLTLL